MNEIPYALQNVEYYGACQGRQYKTSQWSEHRCIFSRACVHLKCVRSLECYFFLWSILIMLVKVSYTENSHNLVLSDPYKQAVFVTFKTGWPSWWILCFSCDPFKENTNGIFRPSVFLSFPQIKVTSEPKTSELITTISPTTCSMLLLFSLQHKQLAEFVLEMENLSVSRAHGDCLCYLHRAHNLPELSCSEQKDALATPPEPKKEREKKLCHDTKVISCIQDHRYCQNKSQKSSVCSWGGKWSVIKTSHNAT